MKKSAFSIMAIVASSLMLTGCFGKVVEVPPAYEGKILTKNGYLPESYPPSVFRLPPCWTPGAICDKLVLIEKSDRAVEEQFSLFMPRDQLNLTFDLRMTASIRDGSTDTILDRVPLITRNSDGQNVVPHISFDKVYDTYARPIIREVVRSVVADFSIDEILSSRDAVNQEINERLSNSLSGVPVILKTAGLADVQYPEVITKQKELTAQRKIEIDQQEAKKQIRLIELEADLEAARAERGIRREKAQAAAEENEIAAKSVTPEYLEYKKLEVLEKLAENGNSVFVPFEALDEVGLSQKIFNDTVEAVKEN